MRISDFGLAFISGEEAFIDHVYIDPAKKPTIGIGHLIRPGETFPPRITLEEGMRLFRRDLAPVEDAVTRLFTYPLTQRQFDMLCSLTFNEGIGRIERSRLRQALNVGDVGTMIRRVDAPPAYTGAMREWAEFCKATVDGELVTLPVLVARRQREITLFVDEARRRIGPTANAPDLRDPNLSELSRDDDDSKPPPTAA